MSLLIHVLTIKIDKTKPPTSPQKNTGRGDVLNPEAKQIDTEGGVFSPEDGVSKKNEVFTGPRPDAPPKEKTKAKPDARKGLFV